MSVILRNVLDVLIVLVASTALIVLNAKTVSIVKIAIIALNPLIVLTVHSALTT